MQRVLLLTVILVCLSGGAAFAAHGHYVPGVEGIKAATLPPPGFYWRMYNLYYTADDLRDDHGRSAPGKFDVDVFTMVNRALYSTDVEILGGNLLLDLVIPLVYTDISYNIGGHNIFDDERFNLGDILAEPLLAWHGDRYDIAFGLGMFMPTGEYSDTKAASPGKGFWSVLTTLGGTVYLDVEKSWSASLLGRYEIHTEQKDTDITPGNDLTLEWGLGKTFNQVFTIGAAGYFSWQTTDDSGDDAMDTRARTMAAGPEIAFVVPSWQLQVSLRSLWEFENKSASQGNVTTLTLTRAF